MIASSRRFANPMPLHAASSLPVSSSPMTGTNLVGVFGWRTQSIGDRPIACSSTSNHLKYCCSPLCLFTAVDADRVSIIHA
jgi:hypothetical protein